MIQSRIDMCLAAKLFYPTYTGAGLRFQRYAPGLKARGIEMRVFAGTPEENRKTGFVPENGLKGGTLLPIKHLDGLAIQRVQLPNSSSFSRNIQYGHALLNYCQCPATRPDLMHLISTSLYWLPYFLSFRRLDLPIVVSHTLLGSLSGRNWKRCLQHLYWRLPFQLADCVVTPSIVGHDALREIGVSRRIEVISNGLDLNRFKPVTSNEKKLALRKHLDLNPTAELILFVGALIERKGADLLFEAWRIIAQACPCTYLILIGPKPQEFGQEADFQNKIDTLAVNSGAADRIIFAGRVNNVEDYYQAADLFVFPSQREGAPNAVLEAFGCGLATILTPFIGLSDELGYPDQHYLLVDRTPEALARTAIALLKSPERQHQLGYHSRKWVESHMDIEWSLDQYANLYRELIDRFRNRKL